MKMNPMQAPSLDLPAPQRPGLAVWRLGVLALCSLALSACVVAPPRHAKRHAPPPAPPEATHPALYFYPSQGQSAQRQDRDRFECYQWARQQTGTDPGMTPVSRPMAAPRPAPERGPGAAVGAVTGAVVGAAVTSPRHTGEGMVLGAVIGGLIGAAGEQQRAQASEDRAAARSQRSQSRADDTLNGFRRAMSACMTARGYSVG